MNRIHQTVVCSAAVASLAFGGFAWAQQHQHQQQVGTTQPTTQQAGQQSTSDGPVQLNDGNIIALVIAINQAEIAAANVAMQKNIDDDYKDFAEEMKDAHTENNEKLRELAQQQNLKPAPAKPVNEIEQISQRMLQKLQTLEGKEFSRAYIGAMVDSHVRALSKIDTAQPMVLNQELKDFLQSTREHVASHLEEAQNLQAELVKERM